MPQWRQIPCFPAARTLSHNARKVQFMHYGVPMHFLIVVCTHHHAVGSLVVRASDSRSVGLGSMPDATKYPPSTHGIRAR
ncbi:hypothetical protein TNCV_2086671 [Trichonephila clavipes]|nr:hypothetical protein TNCV_2086671 [Trichonephila clavipes]